MERCGISAFPEWCGAKSPQSKETQPESNLFALHLEFAKAFGESEEMKASLIRSYRSKYTEKYLKTANEGLISRR